MTDALDRIGEALEQAAAARVVERHRRKARRRTGALVLASTAVVAGGATAATVELRPFGWFESAPSAGRPATTPDTFEIEDGSQGRWTAKTFTSQEGLACVAAAHSTTPENVGADLSCRDGLALILSFDESGPVFWSVKRAGESALLYGLALDSVKAIELQYEDGGRVKTNFASETSVRTDVRLSPQPTAEARDLVDRYPRQLELRLFAVVPDAARRPSALIVSFLDGRPPVDVAIAKSFSR